MRYTLITQAVLVIVALVIIFSFIRPMFGEIKVTQDELFQYSDAVAKASQFNARLRELISTRDSFSQDQVATLERFIPSSIDTLRVMREISSIFEARNVAILSLQAREKVVPFKDIAFESGIVSGQSNNSAYYQDFEVGFNGSYSDLKNVLMLAEQNSLLLEVIDLSFQSFQEEDVTEADGQINGRLQKGQHNFLITFRSYGLADSAQ